MRVGGRPLRRKEKRVLFRDRHKLEKGSPFGLPYTRKTVHDQQPEENEATENLARIRDHLVLMSTAHRMASMGTTRATVGQVTEKAKREQGLSLKPWEAGQVFSEYRVRRAVSHGKPRLVLDAQQLYRVCKQIESKVSEIAPEAEKASQEVEDMVRKVTGLEESHRKAQELMERERELNRFLFYSRGAEGRLADLERKAAELRDRASEVEDLERECARLEARLDELPALETSRQDLEARLAEHVQEEREVSRKEEALAERIQKLVGRRRWVYLAELNQEIEEAEADLDRLRKQLGEKRSLVDRLRGKSKGVIE